MSILKLLRTASPGATRLAASALALLTFKIVVLNRWGAVAPAIYDLGLVLEAVLASVVASYVFYLVVVHIKEENDRGTVGPYIDRHTRRVIGDCESQLTEISKASGTPLSIDTVTEDSLKKAFSAIPPYSNAPLILSPGNTNANWFQYFDYHKSRSKESISRVLAQLIYIDSKRVSLLASVDDCIHFSTLSLLLHTRVNNPSLEAFASTFLLYCEHCRSLKQYMEAK